MNKNNKVKKKNGQGAQARFELLTLGSWGKPSPHQLGQWPNCDNKTRLYEKLIKTINK